MDAWIGTIVWLNLLWLEEIFSHFDLQQIMWFCIFTDPNLKTQV